MIIGITMRPLVIAPLFLPEFPVTVIHRLASIPVICLLAASAALSNSASAADDVLVKNITPGSGSTTFYSTAYAAPDGVTNYLITPDAIYRSDGTASGTVPIPLPTGVDGSTVTNLMAFVGSSVFFTGRSAAYGSELYQLSGNTISLVADTNPGSANGVTYPQVAGEGTRAVFAADDGGGTAAWFVDGGGTPTKLTGTGVDVRGIQLVPGTHEVLFSSTTGLWRFDLDSAINASNPGLVPSTIRSGFGGAVELSGQRLLWYTQDYIYRYDHGSGTVELLGSFPAVRTPFVAVSPAGPDDIAYFFLFDYSATPRTISLWSSDGTVGGTWGPSGAITALPDTSGGLNLDIVQHKGRHALTVTSDGQTTVYGGDSTSLTQITVLDTQFVRLAPLNDDLCLRAGNSLYRINERRLQHLWSIPSLSEVLPGLQRWFVRASPSGTQRIFAVNQTSCIEVSGDYAAGWFMGLIQNDCLFTATTTASGRELHRIGNLRPTCHISPDNTATNATSLTFTVTFSAPVTGFDTSDIAVSGGSKGAFAGSDAVYTLVVNPDANATVTVSVADSAAIALGLPTTAASASVISDRTPPTVTISPVSGNTGNNPIRFTATTAGAVTELNLGLPVTTGGTLSSGSGSASLYEFRVTPTGGAGSVVTLTIPANTIFDAAGNGNALCQASVSYDPALVGVTITPNATVYNTATIPFTITFAAPVTNFTLGDIAINGGTATALTGSGTTYSLVVTPTADGPVSASFVSGVAQDGSGNNCSAGFAQVLCDRTGPVVTLTSPSDFLPVGGSVTLTARLSEPVWTLNAGKILVNGGTLGAITGSGKEWFINVTALNMDGILTATMQSGAATDTGTNPNSPATCSMTVGKGPTPGGSGGGSTGGSGGGGGCGIGSGMGVTLLFGAFLTVPWFRHRRRSDQAGT